MNTFVRQLRGIILTCGALFWLSHVASAQGLGTISGTVVDPTGASVPSASVILTQVKTGQTVSVQTHSDGLYVFPSVSPTDYKLDITAPGFKKYEQVGITLLADQSLTLNVTLQVGSEQVTVDVESSAPQVNATTGTLSQVIGQQQVNELPLNGRNGAALTTLVAGVVIAPNAQADQGATRDISRGRYHRGEWDTGGTDELSARRRQQRPDEYMNVNAPFPMPDALQEFKASDQQLQRRVWAKRRQGGQPYYQEWRQQVPWRPV